MKVKGILNERVRTRENCGPDIRNRSGTIIGIEPEQDDSGVVRVLFDGYDRPDWMPLSFLYPVDAVTDLGNLVDL